MHSIKDRPSRGDQCAHSIAVRLRLGGAVTGRDAVGCAEVSRRRASKAFDDFKAGRRQPQPALSGNRRITRRVGSERLQRLVFCPARAAPARPVEGARKDTLDAELEINSDAVSAGRPLQHRPRASGEVFHPRPLAEEV